MEWTVFNMMLDVFLVGKLVISWSIKIKWIITYTHNLIILSKLYTPWTHLGVSDIFESYNDFWADLWSVYLTRSTHIPLISRYFFSFDVDSFVGKQMIFAFIIPHSFLSLVCPFFTFSPTLPSHGPVSRHFIQLTLQHSTPLSTHERRLLIFLSAHLTSSQLAGHLLPLLISPS